MRIHKKKQALIVGLFPIIILLGMTILPLFTLLYGEEILLETIPYDPRDLLRGDYVALDYKISEVDIDKFPEELKGENLYKEYRNKKIYGVLKKDKDFYVIDYMTYEKPKDKIYLTTKLDYFFPFQEPNSPVNKIHVDYNLDRYFVPENTGKDLEEMSRKGELAARIMVYNGYAILEEIVPKEEIASRDK